MRNLTESERANVRRYKALHPDPAVADLPDEVVFALMGFAAWQLGEALRDLGRAVRDLLPVWLRRT